MALDNSIIEIPFPGDVEVASNELFLRATINRNLEKLLKNDIALANKIEEYGTNSEFSIQGYKPTRIYNAGDAILWTEYSDDGTEVKNIYLLESMIANNANEPAYEVVDGFIKDFSKSGWKNSNPFFSIYSSNDPALNISSFIESSISSKFELSHENDPQYHKFGAISKDTLSSKVLLNGMENIADSRPSLFWAYETGRFSNGSSHGTYKKWGNGVIEYDIEFSLDSSVKLEKMIAENGIVETVGYVKVNSLVPISSEANDSYFLNEDAYTIFNKSGSSKKYNVGGVTQTNVSSKVNTYHGTIMFPIPFIDDSYMIFTSEPTDKGGYRSQSSSTLAFLDRTKQSITAIYTIPNYNGADDIQDMLLNNNSFQCQIIGRWK